MSVFIIAEANNLAKIFLLPLVKGLVLLPVARVLLFWHFYWAFFFLFFFPCFITYGFFSLISLIGFVGFILILLLEGRTLFLLSFFRLVAEVDTQFQRSFSLGTPLVQMGISINVSFGLSHISFTN